MVHPEIEKSARLFEYDPVSGDLFKVSKNGDRLLVRNKSKHGYIRGSHAGRYFFAHRMAWRLFFGVWPKFPVDHINGDRADNRIENLRIADSSQNQQNRHAVRGASRFKGVSLHRKTRKWQAGIKKDGNFKYLGLFESEEDAAAAYNAAAIDMFGKFSKLNEIGGAE